MPDSAPPRPAPVPPGAAPQPGYRGLRVWQRALDLTVDAATLARALDGDGHAALAADLLRAGMAVPAHVAAGSAAATRGEHQHALAAALAAVARFETVLAATERIAPDSASACAALSAGTADVARSLRAFARAVGGAPVGGAPAGGAPVGRAARSGASHDTPPADGNAPAGHPDAEHAPRHTRADEPIDEATAAPPMPTRPARARRTAARRGV